MRKKVLVLGGNFGGLTAALAREARAGRRCRRDGGVAPATGSCSIPA